MPLFRRRKSSKEDVIEGEIIEESAEQSPEDEPSLERVAPDVPTPDELEITEFTRRSGRGQSSTTTRRLPRFQFKLPHLLVWREVRPGLLLLSLGLVAGGIFWTLYNLGRLSSFAQDWWAAVLLGFAFVWALISLLTRKAQAFLAASVLAGISISLLLNAHDFADWRDTMVGVVLITLGLGIIARGLLLRQGSIAH